MSKIFYSSPVMKAVIEVNTGNCIKINNSFTKYTCYDAQEIIGKAHWLDWIFSNRFDVKADDLPSEVNYLTKSGDSRTGQLSTEVLRHNGKPCLLISITDVTEYKLIQKELARQNQLNLVGEMAASIGHEIRNPMTTVRGFLQILGDKSDFAGYRDFFQLMTDELDRANAIITEFLYMAKNKKVDLVRKNLNDILQAILPLIKADALLDNKGVVLMLSEIPDVAVDEREIRQVIINFVRNALDVTSEGEDIVIKTFIKDDNVVLAVNDKGPGINPDIIDKIGTPFVTTKENGTGLGLAVSYSIAARHRASISFETGNAGTTFYVIFHTANEQYQYRT